MSNIQAFADHLHMLAIEAGAAPAGYQVQVTPGSKQNEIQWSIGLYRFLPDGQREMLSTTFLSELDLGYTAREAESRLLVAVSTMRAACVKSYK